MKGRGWLSGGIPHVAGIIRRELRWTRVIPPLGGAVRQVQGCDQCSPVPLFTLPVGPHVSGTNPSLGPVLTCCLLSLPRPSA